MFTNFSPPPFLTFLRHLHYFVTSTILSPPSFFPLHRFRRFFVASTIENGGGVFDTSAAPSPFFFLHHVWHFFSATTILVSNIILSLPPFLMLILYFHHLRHFHQFRRLHRLFTFTVLEVRHLHHLCHFLRVCVCVCVWTRMCVHECGCVTCQRKYNVIESKMEIQGLSRTAGQCNWALYKLNRLLASWPHTNFERCIITSNVKNFPMSVSIPR